MDKLKIDNELKNLIPPLHSDELKNLEKSLANEGWRNNERILTWNGVIIDGHNRYLICIKNSIEFKTKEISFKDKNEVTLWMIDNQLARRNLSDYSKVLLSSKREDILKIQTSAKEQQGSRTDLFLVSKKKLASINTVKETAKKTGHSTDKISKVRFLEKNANEDTKKKLAEGEETINKAYTVIKKKDKVKKIKKELRLRIKNEENKSYEIIYADPPWKYNRNVGEGVASEEYSLMDNNKIGSYLSDNKIITEDNSLLFLWITFPLLKEGLEVLEAWGFEYKTCGFNWIKLNKNGKPFFGIGHYTKSNSELCLIGIKGKGLTILDDTISQIVMTEKDKHSKKPDCIPDLIVRLVGDRKRAELFARKKREGWDVYGDEV